MSTSIELQAKAFDYLQGRANIRDLEHWLAPRLPIYLSNLDTQDAKLVMLVQLRLAEMHAGIRSERSLRQHVKRLLQAQKQADKPVVYKYDFAQQPTALTADTSVNLPWTIPTSWKAAGWWEGPQSTESIEPQAAPA